MSPELAIEVISKALMMAFWLASPLLMIGFTVGIAINLVQVLTSMQDSVFSTVPRLGAFLFGFLLLMPWMVTQMTDYTRALFQDLWRYAG
ncbi:MAG: flagellar biosynthetic protein FliQ [Bryobacterales bacterium]|jgi:flagellar biosynthetic protein FliQ